MQPQNSITYAKNGSRRRLAWPAAVAQGRARKQGHLLTNRKITAVTGNECRPQNNTHLLHNLYETMTIDGASMKQTILAMKWRIRRKFDKNFPRGWLLQPK